MYGGVLISKRKKVDDLWLKALGEHIKQLILKKGFNSPYDFWVQSLGEDVSRATLNYVLNGVVDAKAGTLKKIADALGIPAREIFNFKQGK